MFLCSLETQGWLNRSGGDGDPSEERGYSRGNHIDGPAEREAMAFPKRQGPEKSSIEQQGGVDHGREKLRRNLTNLEATWLTGR